VRSYPAVKNRLERGQLRVTMPHVQRVVRAVQRVCCSSNGLNAGAALGSVYRGLVFVWRGSSSGCGFSSAIGFRVRRGIRSTIGSMRAGAEGSADSFDALVHSPANSSSISACVPIASSTFVALTVRDTNSGAPGVPVGGTMSRRFAVGASGMIPECE
jgi:hypothetical protein